MRRLKARDTLTSMMIEKVDKNNICADKNVYIRPLTGSGLIRRRSALGALALALGAVVLKPLHAAAAPLVTPPVITPKPGGAYQVIMVEQRGCAGCASFLREVGPIYAQTAPEIPLIRVDIHQGNWPEGIVIGARPNATPTFLVLRDGIETRRIFGFSGKKRFWQALQDAVTQEA
ncbi:hypothetical protein [Albirhodobacter sp. R86504]|uniref:hypothetical protein n=1 Tax=Albirhodobacter sp. R86504 TaxID=3093848 RepID=UPI00366C5AE6